MRKRHQIQVLLRRSHELEAFNRKSVCVNLRPRLSGDEEMALGELPEKLLCSLRKVKRACAHAISASHRAGDVILLDPTDDERPVGLTLAGSADRQPGCRHLGSKGGRSCFTGRGHR